MAMLTMILLKWGITIVKRKENRNWSRLSSIWRKMTRRGFSQKVNIFTLVQFLFDVGKKVRTQA